MSLRRWTTSQRAQGFALRDGHDAESRPRCCGTGKVAVQSAKRFAPSLVPVLLYPGRRNAFVDWFEAQGGLAFQHRTSLLHRWQVPLARACDRPGAYAAVLPLRSKLRQS